MLFKLKISLTGIQKKIRDVHSTQHDIFLMCIEQKEAFNKYFEKK